MGWTTPVTWSNGSVPGATDLNAQIRDNLLFLFSGRALQKIAYEGSADKTTTSTSFVAVDTTNLRCTLTVTTGRVLVFGRGNWSNSTTTAQMYADFLMDGATRAGGTNNGLAQQETGSTGTGYWPFSILGIFTGVSSGSHTFDLAWKVSAGTATMLNNTEPIVLIAMEI